MPSSCPDDISTFHLDHRPFCSCQLLRRNRDCALWTALSLDLFTVPTAAHHTFCFLGDGALNCNSFDCDRYPMSWIAIDCDAGALQNPFEQRGSFVVACRLYRQLLESSARFLVSFERFWATAVAFIAFHHHQFLLWCSR
jgi:hypothetical protein